MAKGLMCGTTQATDPVSISEGQKRPGIQLFALMLPDQDQTSTFYASKDDTWCAFPLDPILPPRPKPFNYLLQNPFKVTEEWALPLPPSLCPHPAALEPAKIYWVLHAKPWRGWSGFSPTCIS